MSPQSSTLASVKPSTARVELAVLYGALTLIAAIVFGTLPLQQF